MVYIVVLVCGCFSKLNQNKNKKCFDFFLKKVKSFKISTLFFIRYKYINQKNADLKNNHALESHYRWTKNFDKHSIICKYLIFINLKLCSDDLFDPQKILE